MGGMISFYLNANYPDMFAASIFVGSQWVIKVLKPLVDKKFFYIVSARNEKERLNCTATIPEKSLKTFFEELLEIISRYWLRHFLY